MTLTVAQKGLGGDAALSESHERKSDGIVLRREPVACLSSSASVRAPPRRGERGWMSTRRELEGAAGESGSRR